MSVVQFARKGDVPHLAGTANCFACSHEWEAVAPVGTLLLECPECGCHRGVYQFSVERRDSHWKCNCGNYFFLVSPDGCYCPNCGEWARF